MGTTMWSPLAFIKRLNKYTNMEFTKKTLNETLDVKSNGKKSFSEKPQNIVISESQLERLIEKLNSTK
jgi:hypothetical protein